MLWVVHPFALFAKGRELRISAARAVANETSYQLSGKGKYRDPSTRDDDRLRRPINQGMNGPFDSAALRSGQALLHPSPIGRLNTSRLAEQLQSFTWAERHAHTGGQQQVVSLQSENRITDVAVAERDLPAQEAADPGNGGAVKNHAIVS